MAEDHSKPVFPTTRQSAQEAAHGKALSAQNVAYMSGSYAALEEAFLAGHDLIRGSDAGPERFDAYQAEKERGLHSELPGTDVAARVVNQLHEGLKRSFEAVDHNPAQAKTGITNDEITQLEATLRGIGVSSIGYTEIPDQMIFKDKGVIGRAAVVIALPMDAEMLKTAPSAEAYTTVLGTYAGAGDAANVGASYLQGMGFAAQASHALMGMAILPPLARRAGLGWLGESGMLITPEHGPGVRIAAIFTTIENLPISEDNPHEWVGEYCKRCGNCARQCPSGAIMRDPIIHADGRVTTIVREKCFSFYLDNYSCGVCLIACPFFRLSYEKVKKSYAKVLEREAKGNNLRGEGDASYSQG